MSFVVVGAPFGLSRSHWKQRLGAIQSLDLDFSSTHNTSARSAGRDRARRCRVPSRQTADRWTARTSCCDAAVARRPPNAVHRRDRQARRLGHRARSPVRCGGRHGLQGCRHHLGDLVIADLAWRARAGSFSSPPRRFAANRIRQVVTVTRVIRSRLAMPRLVMPPAARSTISARRASARKLFRRRARASSSARSAPASSIKIAARPRIPDFPKHPAGTGIDSQQICLETSETGH